MNRIATTLLLTVMMVGLAHAQGLRTSTFYNYPLLTGSPTDSVLNGLKSIRACNFHPDVDGNGKSEIVVTNYADGGHVSVFEAVGNDSIRLVWTSPYYGTGAGSSPRYALFGDLDNDGKYEVIFQLRGVGFLIFEWDGVIGSHNYGTAPSQIITSPLLANLITTYTEYFEVLDIDGDGMNELVTAYDAGANTADRYLVIHAVGDWSTNDPGFSTFETELDLGRTDLSAKYGLPGGSPVAMITANLDGVGNREIIIQNYNLKNIVPMRVPSANTYLLSDTTRNKQNLYLGGASDDVALFGGMAYDIDKDGRQEVYLPTYPAAGSPNAGKIHMITYDPGQSTAEIDSSNVTALDLTGVVGPISIFGYGYGDIDKNGKPNLYFSTVYPYNVVSLEFQGGNKKLQANWKASVLYAGEPTIYDSLTVRDSLGRVDTTKYVNTAFASKIFARATDFDKDGFEDILLPYQALNDTVSVRRRTWSASTSSYTDVVTKSANPKRWGFRIIEGSPTTGVEVKDLTIIMPEDFILEQNYPNPFNPSTTIRFKMPVKEKISLKIFDTLGKEVRTLLSSQEFPKGNVEVVWDGKNNRGEQVASGMYFYSLFFGNFQKTQKMVLMK